jgi:hypothetical protein
MMASKHVPGPVLGAGLLPHSADTDAWDRFWRSGRKASCYEDSDGRYLPPIRDLWHQFFADLPVGARVIDVGTGNGAVPLEACHWGADNPLKQLELHGVDRAAIRSESRSINGCRLTLTPRVDMRDLPFEDSSFDAATAQFALEYLHWSEALPELARVMRPGARMRAVLHLQGAVSHLLADAELAELSAIRSSGLLEAARLMFADGEDRRVQHLQALQSMAAGLQANMHPLATICRTVLNNLDHFMSVAAPLPAPGLVEAVQTLAEELDAHGERLRQLLAAAIDGRRRQLLAAALTSAGFDRVVMTRLKDPQSGALLALQLNARRR